MQQVGLLPQTGVLHLFIKHTSAGLVINEDADPSVRVDFESMFNRLVPENEPYLTHTFEGPDDMPAHIRTMLTQTSLSVPVIAGKLQLGTWQGIYLIEHRDEPHTREIATHLAFES